MENIHSKDLLKKIQELEFAAVEINLYLDTHPENKNALSDYNKVCEELKELKKMYEKEVGPLMNFGYSPSEYPFKWVNEPWPWEQA